MDDLLANFENPTDQGARAFVEQMVADHPDRTEPLPVEVLAEIGPHADAETEAMRALAEDRVRSILDRLTPDQRDVLLLRILGGLTIEEVVTVVRKKPGAVKALQARGIAAIRDEIKLGAVTL